MDSNSGNLVLILILKLRSLLIISKLSILLYIQGGQNVRIVRIFF